MSAWGCGSVRPLISPLIFTPNPQSLTRPRTALMRYPKTTREGSYFAGYGWAKLASGFARHVASRGANFARVRFP